MKVLLTGSSKGIGYNIAKRLNLMGIKDLILLDNKEKFENPTKFLNLEYEEYRNYTDLSNLKNIKYIFHEGACSDTMEYNKDYMMGINYEYSKEIFSIGPFFPNYLCSFYIFSIINEKNSSFARVYVFCFMERETSKMTKGA